MECLIFLIMTTCLCLGVAQLPSHQNVPRSTIMIEITFMTAAMRNFIVTCRKGGEKRGFDCDEWIIGWLSFEGCKELL